MPAKSQSESGTHAASFESLRFLSWQPGLPVPDGSVRRSLLERSARMRQRASFDLPIDGQVSAFRTEGHRFVFQSKVSDPDRTALHLDWSEHSPAPRINGNQSFVTLCRRTSTLSVAQPNGIAFGTHAYFDDVIPIL